MPNIIEQQDLLKGLPDARLAMLLQNPVGDIPPFLVAAEAQRRQAIRQQFAGSENKESVVDSLTKQLANVPQNIPAPTRTPPMVPPTPEMQGVAALQAQQAVQQMAQPQETQTMRDGGVVQRYQSAGVVMPLEQRRQAVMDQFGVDQNEALQMIGDRPDIGVPKIEGDLGKPFYVPETNNKPAASPLDLGDLNFSDYVRMGYGVTFPPLLGLGMDPFSIAKNRENINYKEYEEMNARDKEAAARRMAAPPYVPPEELARQREEQARLKRQYAEYAASRQEKQPEETEDEFRTRMRALLAVQEPSDWEKAQKYFAMAEQFFDPSKTTMQSIAGAGQAFAQSAAEQARAQREAEFNLEKAMLEMDIAERDRIRAAQVAEKERTSLTADQQANILVKSQESVRRIIDSKREQLQKLTSDPMSAQFDPSIPARIAALEAEIARDEQRLMSIEGALAALGQQAYGNIPFDTYSLTSGFAR